MQFSNRSILILFFTGCLLTGWFVARNTFEKPETPEHTELNTPQSALIDSRSIQPNRATQRTRHQEKAMPVGAIANERILTFRDQTSLEAFLRQIGDAGVSVLGQSQFTKSLRVRFQDLRELESLLGEGGEMDYNFEILPPELEASSLNPNAVPFLGRMKEWLGITQDNSEWGTGVKVAVVDTGLQSHHIFGEDVQQFSLVDIPPDFIPHPHGTAMASLWREGDGEIPAIAPGVDLMSIQVAGEDGGSNTYLLTEAIYLAVAEGANIVTVSMGSYGQSAGLNTAIQHAKENGVLIVASAGNNNSNLPVVPASHDDVVGIGGIGYLNNKPGFSNYGINVDFVAPAVGVKTAGEEEAYTYSTGTSPAAQIGAGVIVAFMDYHGITDYFLAAELVQQNLNDLGIAGPDEEFGGGRPQFDVLANYDLLGVYDVALTSHFFELDETREHASLNIVVDNPGTEPLQKAILDVQVQGTQFSIDLPEIEVKEAFTQYLPLPILLGPSQIVVKTQVRLKPGLTDARLRDNVMQSSFSLPSE